jgi:peptide/nickel transport system permease protein
MSGSESGGPAGGPATGKGGSGPDSAGRGAVGGLLDFLLPGARAALSGRSGGVAVLGAWAFLWAIAVLRADRIVATLRGGAMDHWLALVTLVGGLGACPFIARRWLRGPGTRAAGRETGPIDWQAFGRHRQASVGLVLLAALILVALLTPYLAPFDPNAQHAVVATRFLPPSALHPLGTDRFGRDVLSRVLYGARISLSIGIVAVTIAVTVGALVGSGAGLAGGAVDTLSMRGVDLLLSFPRLVLLIALVALFEPSLGLVTAVLGLTGWMGTARIVRGQVLSIREEDYVQAARALGLGRGRTLLRHVLPNAFTPVIVAATLGVGNTILAEAALSFLGLGVQPPTASWGNMVASGRDVMLDSWWIATFPGLAIVLTVMCFNLVGDGLRDALDPRHVRGA